MKTFNITATKGRRIVAWSFEVTASTKAEAEALLEAKGYIICRGNAQPGGANVIALRQTLKEAGVRLPRNREEDDAYHLKGVTPTKSHLRQLLRSAGWRSQGPGTFPAEDGTFYASARAADGEPSTAAFNFEEGWAVINANT